MYCSPHQIEGPQTHHAINFCAGSPFSLWVTPMYHRLEGRCSVATSVAVLCRGPQDHRRVSKASR